MLMTLYLFEDIVYPLDARWTLECLWAIPSKYCFVLGGYM